jgi:UDP:flavonoid glycosyltransferase YjiC (YdhE family)
VRILFTFAGGTGHFLPLVPLAHAARRAGHEVAFAGQQRMVPVVREAGFEAFDTGGSTLLRSTSRIELRPVNVENELLVARDVYAGSVARERAPRVLDLADEWRPDVFVCDEMDFGAFVAAERLAVPWATVLCIATGLIASARVVGSALSELRSLHGLASGTADIRERYLVLSPFPPSLRDASCPLPATAHGLSWEMEPDAEAPGWMSQLDPEATAYFTLGTIFNLESGDLFERVLEGLRTLPLEVVVTVGRELDPAVLGSQPANVRVERFVPQSLLLPRCSLVVSHAGSGSVVGALAHALPMVLLPIGADQPLTAARCEELGVARVLDALRATADEIRDAAADVLATPSYRRNAAAIAGEIRELPGPAQAVALLERLAAEAVPLPGP